jgi:uncharacterized protein (TIGR02001 family)
MKQVLLATLLATSTWAVADEATTLPLVNETKNWSASVTATSEYLFRGLKQTQGDPALQGQLGYDMGNGIYVGAWASSIKWTKDGNYMNNNDVETNFWAGYANTLGDTGIGYDVGILQYYYPGTVKNGIADADATELYASVNKDIAGMNLAVKYSQVVSDDAWGIADADGSQYLEAQVTVPLTEQLSAIAHIGRSEFDGSGNAAYDYTDWKLGAEYAYNDSLTLGAGWSDTNANEASWTLRGEDQGEGQALAWATWNF